MNYRDHDYEGLGQAQVNPSPKTPTGTAIDLRRSCFGQLHEINGLLDQWDKQLGQLQERLTGIIADRPMSAEESQEKLRDIPGSPLQSELSQIKKRLLGSIRFLSILNERIDL